MAPLCHPQDAPVPKLCSVRNGLVVVPIRPHQQPGSTPRKVGAALSPSLKLEMQLFHTQGKLACLLTSHARGWGNAEKAQLRPLRWASLRPGPPSEATRLSQWVTGLP